MNNTQLADKILKIHKQPRATKSKGSKDGFIYFHSKEADIVVGISKAKYKHGYEFVVCCKEDHDEVIDLGFIDRKGHIFKIERRIDIDTSIKKRVFNFFKKYAVQMAVWSAILVKSWATLFINKYQTKEAS